MPQLIGDGDIYNFNANSSDWPTLACSQANLLTLINSDLQLEAARSLRWPGSGQLSFEGEGQISAQGALSLRTGGPPTEQVRVLADGKVGIGTNAPSARLHVIGAIQAEGSLRVTGDATLDANLNVVGTANLGGNTQVQGNLQVTGRIDASEVRQNGAGLVSSQWSTLAGGINFAGGNVGIGDATPDERLDVAGRIKAGVLTMGPWPADGNLVFLGTNTLDQAQSGNYALLQDTSGPNIGRTLLNSPKQIHFRINNSDRMFLANNGNLGIGTTTPNTALEIVRDWSGEEGTLRLTGDKPTLRFTGGAIAGNQSWILHLGSHGPGNLAFYRRTGVEAWAHLLSLTPGGNVGIGTISPAFKLDVAGPAHASSFPTSSDARFKTNVAHLTNVLAKLEQLHTVSFDWNETYAALGRATGQREIGVLAQEVEAVFPELVTTWGAEGYRAVDYGRLTAILIAAIKELATRLSALESNVSV